MTLDKNKLDNVFAKTVSKANKGAVSAVIFDDKEILYTAYDGYLNRPDQIAPAADSLFMIGSNTKVLTTLGLLRLVEDGKLDMQDDIRKYIPEFSIKSRFEDAPFTIENFLRHRSGLVCDMYQYMVQKPYTFHDIVAGVKDTYRTALPGEMFSYSNLGFSLMGEVIERVSGMKYTEFMQKYLFEPLDMEVYIMPEAELPKQTKNRVALSYDGNGNRQIDPLGCELPAGACTYTRITDLAKIGQLFMNEGKYGNKRLYKKSTLKWMEELPVEDELDNELAVVGHSLFHNKHLSDYETGPFLGHGGATVYHFSYFDWLPQEKVGVITFTSYGTGRPVIQQLEKELFNEYFRQNGNQKRDTKFKEGDYDITSLIGKYDTLFGPVNFALNDNGSLVVENSGAEFKTAVSNDGWVKCTLPRGFKNLKADAKMIKDHSLKQAVYYGHEVLIMDDGTSKTVIGCRYTEPKINAVWLKAVGKYRPEISTPMFFGFNLELENGELVLHVRLSGDDNALNYYLQVLNDNEALVKGYGRNMRQTVYLKQDKGYFLLTADGLTGRKKIKA